MKERPILFSTEMVKAILEGRKTQTRRIIKKQPHRMATEVIKSSQWRNGDFVARFKYHDEEKYQVTNILKCPYGQSGDRLWVRETFSVLEPEHVIGGRQNRFVYKAEMKSAESEEVRREYIRMGYPYQWRPSIFMPREASRILLEVTDVRVDRLQDISDKDCIAEGIDYVVDKITGYCGYNYLSGGYNLMTTPYHGYRSLWESINGKGSWDKNPWVWVIEFRRVS